jgi:hypothetical protein
MNVKKELERCWKEPISQVSLEHMFKYKLVSWTKFVLEISCIYDELVFLQSRN